MRISRVAQPFFEWLACSKNPADVKKARNTAVTFFLVVAAAFLSVAIIGEVQHHAGF